MATNLQGSSHRPRAVGGAYEIERVLFMNKEVRDPFLEGNEIIEQAISTFHKDQSNDNLITVLESIRARMYADGHFVIPVVTKAGDEMTYSFRGLNTNDGNIWNVVFTSQKEFEKGQPSQAISHFIIINEVF